MHHVRPAPGGGRRAGTRAPDDTGVGIVGAGTMGVGIAYVFAAAGRDGSWSSPTAPGAPALAGGLREQAAKGASPGAADRWQADGLPGRVTAVATSAAELPEGLDLVVESVPERLELKHAVLARLRARAARRCSPPTPARCRSTSWPLGCDRPRRFLGMHFFNPVWSLQMVELMRGAATSRRRAADRAELVAPARQAVDRRARRAGLRHQPARHGRPRWRRCGCWRAASPRAEDIDTRR